MLIALWRRRGPILAWLGAAVVVALLIGLLWKLPEWRVATAPLEPKDALQLENSIRATLAQIVAGLFLLLGLYLTWRRVAATERSVEVAQEGQVTERFTRAVEQLGSENLAVRLGGIYALERISRDSEKDYWTIVEVLTAYVRHKAPYVPTQAPTEVADEKGGARYRVQDDVQTALTVLGRRRRAFGRGESQRLELHGADLRGADLPNAHLDGADLSYAYLEGANLFAAHLEGADLRAAHLERAILTAAHLERATLTAAHLERAILTAAHLEGAYLREAHLGRADLRAAHLERANLLGTHLEGVDLRWAVGLTQDQIALARVDDETQLPDYLLREADVHRPAE